MRYGPRITIPRFAGVLLACYAVGSGAQPPLATGDDADVSEDGLHRVDTSVMAGAWVRPDLDLSKYTKVYFLGTGVLFREISGVTGGVGSRLDRSEFPVTPETQLEFRRVFRETLLEDLGGMDRFELTTTPGRDVLIAQGFLVDVVSHIPPRSVGDRATSLRRTWEATIVLELRDSMSHDMLARTVERERPDGYIDAEDVMRETRLLLRRWCRLLTQRMEELAEISVI